MAQARTRRVSAGERSAYSADSVSEGEDRAGGLLGHRFLLFTGKGGVGKTTLTAALAVEAARLGHRPLVVELGHRASMRSVFGVPEIGMRPRPVGHGVAAMSVDVETAVVDYMADQIPSRRVAKAVVQNRVLERLFAAMPAVGEIATVNALRRLMHQTTDDGAPMWSPILVDLDATGHAVMFLELRQVIGGLMGTGPMKKLVDEMAEVFADPTRTRLNIVTLPAELPVSETAELYERLTGKGTVAFGRLFVNRMPVASFDDAQAQQVQRLLSAAQSAGDHDLAADAVFASRAVDDRARALEQVASLRQRVPLPSVELPQRSAARLEIDDLREIGKIALSAVDGPSEGGTP